MSEEAMGATARADEGKALLEVSGLRVRFELPGGPLEVLDQVDFVLQPNEILCVVGESGSGKTVLMHTLLGLLEVEPGVVGGRLLSRLGGQERSLLEGLEKYVVWPASTGERVTRRPGWDRLYRQRTAMLMGKHLGLIFQNPKNALDPLMTVGAQIEESVRQVEPGLSRAQARDASIQWLERVRIDRPGEVVDLYPHQLSGGMCQRVAIAQILALRPQVLIADEPTTGLDATIQASMLTLIREIQQQFGLSIILITHDFEVVERLADRILVLFRGRVMEQGRAQELLATPAQLHPYTRDLLRNVRLLERAGGLEEIRSAGAAASRVRIPRSERATGCNYLPVCPLAASDDRLRARCATERPTLQALSASHGVACHLGSALEAIAV